MVKFELMKMVINVCRCDFHTVLKTQNVHSNVSKIVTTSESLFSPNRMDSDA